MFTNHLPQAVFHTHTRTRTHMRMHTCMNMHTRTNTHAPTHMNTRTHAHEHAHTHTQMLRLVYRDSKNKTKKNQIKNLELSPSRRSRFLPSFNPPKICPHRVPFPQGRGQAAPHTFTTSVMSPTLHTPCHVSPPLCCCVSWGAEIIFRTHVSTRSRKIKDPTERLFRDQGKCPSLWMKPSALCLTGEVGLGSHPCPGSLSRIPVPPSRGLVWQTHQARPQASERTALAVHPEMLSPSCQSSLCPQGPPLSHQ